MNEIHFQITAGTDIGLHRSNNEDNFIAGVDLSKQEWFVPQNTNDVFTLSELGCLLAVADGMGGMNAGEIASAIAIETMQQYFSPQALEEVNVETKSIEKYMKEALVAADKNIKKYSKENKETAGMGTTLVLAWVLKDRVYIAWCGDSRAYSWHPQAELKQLSKDHSFVQELVDKGRLDPQYAFDHPDRNIITRSLGDPSATASPDFIEKELFNDEIILLCSDGLSGMVRDERIESILADKHSDIEQCKSALIQEALTAGGYDNISVTLLKTVSGAQPFKDNTCINASGKKKFKNRLIPLSVVIALVITGVQWRLCSTKEIASVSVPESTCQINDSTKNTNDSIKNQKKKIIVKEAKKKPEKGKDTIKQTIELTPIENTPDREAADTELITPK
jgi:protein phosphatase